MTDDIFIDMNGGSYIRVKVVDNSVVLERGRIANASL
jgi:hypothetical protein